MTWQIFGEVLGTTILTSGALSLLFKELIRNSIKHEYDKKIEEFKSVQQKELEGYKAGYKRVLDENQVRFSQYHIKTVGYLEECFARLVDLHVAVSNYCNLNETNITKEKRIEIALSEFPNFFIYFQQKQIFMSKQTADMFDACFRELQKTFLESSSVDGPNPINTDKIMVFSKVSKMLKAMPDLIEQLRKQIRQELMPLASDISLSAEVK